MLFDSSQQFTSKEAVYFSSDKFPFFAVALRRTVEIMRWWMMFYGGFGLFRRFHSFQM